MSVSEEKAVEITKETVVSAIQNGFPYTNVATYFEQIYWTVKMVEDKNP